MTLDQEILIDNVWTFPQQAFVHFTQKGEIGVQVKNISNKVIIIQKVECIFQYDINTEIYIPTKDLWLPLDPYELSEPIYVDFSFDLSFQSFTNSFKIKITDSELRELTYNPHQSFILHQLCQPKYQFFISHKDPEDTEKCKIFANYLEKLGLKSFIAEERKYLGVNFWNEKIIPNIQNSIATIIIFTKEAEKKPDNIFKEVEISFSNAKPLILILEPDVLKPTIFSELDEHYTTPNIIDSLELKKIAIWIHEAHLKGKYIKVKR
jgi:hypothetical protein